LIKAYWLRLLLFAAGGALIALVLSAFAPKKYEAVVEIMVDQQPMSQQMAITAAEQSVQDLIAFGRARSLVTQVQQLVSLGVIRTAADRVAVQFNRQPPTDPSDDLNPFNLQQNILVSAEQQSDLISLRVRMKDPILAQAVAREMYLAFIDQNAGNTRSLAEQAIQLLERQSEDINSQLRAIDERTTALKVEHQMPDLMNQTQAEVQALNTLKQARDVAQMEIAAASRRVEELTREYRNAGSTESGGVATTPNPIYQRLRTDLIMVDSELAAARVRYTDDHEMVQQLLERRRQLENELANQPEKIVSQEMNVQNSNRLALRNALSEARAQLASARARIIEVEREVAVKERRMQELPVVQAQLVDLMRQQAALEKVYFGFMDRLKSLKAAQMGRLAPSREVTPATALPDPVSPKPLVNTLFGLVAGLILGVLSMLATEAKRQPVRSLAQLNALALRPVYRMIPELRAPFRGLSKAPPESFESLLANYLRSPSRPYRIAVVGVNKDAGASTAAINLATAGERHGSKVLVVCCDPKGSLARLAGKQPPTDGSVMDISPAIKGMARDTALALTPGTSGLAPDITALEADLTIIDLEPTTKSAEYAFIAPHVDEVILLVRAGRARSVEFLQAQQALRDAGCPTVTVAFTRSSDLAVVSDALEGERAIEPPDDEAKPLEA
jgi:polysaccharide biosynthesis transport protein